MQYQSCVPKFGDALVELIRTEFRLSYRGFSREKDFPVSTLSRLRDMESPDEANPETIQSLIRAFGWTVPQFNEWWKRVGEGEPSIESLPMPPISP
jgi:hypothetical protein